MSNTLFDKQGHNIPSAILSDKEINDYVQDGYLISKGTFSSSSLEASSYDIRVGKKGIIGGTGNEIDLISGYLELQPGSYAGIVSYEKFKLPSTIAARLGAKRALSYDGIILLTGSIVDPGYEGHLIFGLYNASQRKALLKYGKKICNVVFEKLSIEPDKVVSPDPSLIDGNFPEEFVQKMYSMEVLPWMQISDRVKQIEQITSEIIDLKKRYEDVMKPIAELTGNVKDLTKNVESVNKRTEKLSEDLQDSNKLVTENARQINILTELVKNNEKDLKDVTISFKSSNNLNKIIWSVVIGLIMFMLGLMYAKHS